MRERGGSANRPWSPRTNHGGDREIDRIPHSNRRHEWPSSRPAIRRDQSQYGEPSRPEELRRFHFSNRAEPERYVEIGSHSRRGDYDGAGDGHLRQFSDYSESLSRKGSTFSRFQWHNLLSDHNHPPTNPQAAANAYPNRDSDGSRRNPFVGNYDEPPPSTSSDRKISGFSSDRVGGDGGVVPTSMSKENENYRVDPTGIINYGNIDRGSERRIFQGRTGSIVDSILDKIESPNDALLRDSMRQPPSRIFDRRFPTKPTHLDSMRQPPRMVLDHPFPPKQTHLDVVLDSHSIEPGGIPVENLNGRTSEHVEYWRETVLDREKVQWAEDSGLGRDYGNRGQSGDGFTRVPISYDGLYATERSPQVPFMEEDEEFNFHDPSEMVLERNSLDSVTSWDDEKGWVSCNWNSSYDEIYDTVSGARQLVSEDMSDLSLMDDQGLRSSHGRMVSRTIDDMVVNNGNSDLDNSLSYRYLPVSDEKHLRKPTKASKREKKKRLRLTGNVKHRLGVPKEMHIRKPVMTPKSNIKYRLGPVHSVKQRLGPVPTEKSFRKARKGCRELPWVKIFEERSLEHFDGSFDAEAKKKNKKKPMKTEPLEGFEKKKEPMKTEPSEGSDEFLQLVQIAFLKFVKVLNESSAKQRKYKDQGGIGPLKCGICGSTKEFPNTSSLAQHAFTSCKVGYRSEHLGFHKALCVLMGWTIAEAPNSPWVQQIISEAEAVSLKEDLIIWPPVVIIHNSSIANENTDERMIVSIEGLRVILRGMGFDQWMSNLCRGKAANHSTMVVSFKGTFSGLQEAERLNKFYAENKHGRSEFQQIGCRSSNSGNAETKTVVADNVESILYGYLGIASDLDKLDFETKKRCMVKSKREIEAIADASLSTK